MKSLQNYHAGAVRAIAVILIGATLSFVVYYYNIPLFRLINGHYSEFGDRFFPLITCLGDGLVLGIFLFLLWSDSAVHTLLGLESLVISGIIARILKYSLPMPRPPAILDQVHLVGVEFFKSSFPSGHTTSAFAVGILFYSYCTHRAWKALVIILAVLVGYSRVYLGIHFPLDVLAGAGIGLFCTTFILRHKGHIIRQLDAVSDRHRMVLHRTMMGILAGGGLFLLLFYKQLPGIWFANILGVFAFFSGLFSLWRPPRSV